MSAAELQARITAATAVLADFRRWADGGLVQGDWQDWSLRLSSALAFVLDELARPEPPAAPVAQGGSYVADDGSAWLSPADVRTVREAL